MMHCGSISKGGHVHSTMDCDDLVLVFDYTRDIDRGLKRSRIIRRCMRKVSGSLGSVEDVDWEFAWQSIRC